MWTVVHCLIRHETAGTWREDSVTIERETIWEAMARLSQYLEGNADGVQFGQALPLETAQLVELTVSTWTSRSDFERCTKERRTSLLMTRLSVPLALSSGSCSPSLGTPTAQRGLFPS